MTTRSGAPNFHGRRVLALESRRAAEVGTLIATYGGEALVAPALREVPLESNPDAIDMRRLAHGGHGQRDAAEAANVFGGFVR